MHCLNENIINTVVANATVKALISKYSNAVANVDIESNRWTEGLFKRMNFVKRPKNFIKLGIPEKVRKEIEFLFLHNIVSMVVSHPL